MHLSFMSCAALAAILLAGPVAAQERRADILAAEQARRPPTRRLRRPRRASAWCIYQGDTLFRRLVSFGLDLSPWQTAAKYERHAAIGRFAAASFAPRSWKPRLPVSALFELRD